MLSSSRALTLASRQGQPLRQVDALAHLYSKGVTFRRSQLCMVAGISGAMKSTFALWFAIQANVPTLYISADMGPTTALSRSAATITGDSTSSITKAIDAVTGSPEALEYYQGEVSDLRIQWAFKPTPSLDDIQLDLDAYVDIWDAYPELIVVDNLMDIDVGEESHGGQTFVMKELHALARNTGACVIVLHHCRENPDNKEKFDPGSPPPRWHIKNKVDEKPEVILTVAHDKVNDFYKIAVVKLRDGGKPDEAAQDPVVLRAEPERCAFYRYSDGRF